MRPTRLANEGKPAARRGRKQPAASELEAAKLPKEAEMSNAVLSYPRIRVARFAVAAAVGVGGLACASAAQASSAPGVDAHVHQADVALRAFASASASASGSGKLDIPLSKVTAQLGIA